MTHAPLFAGINGFGLAADWMGWEQHFHCEIDPFCQKVIQHYWKQSIPYHDIRETDFTIHRGQIDVLSGGFPCQPYSTAGKRLGKEDDRHLWPEMLRAIREIKPSYVVGENVRGLLNWSGGLVFDEVQDDLEAEGYEVLPFLLPACSVNAPHRRDRIWFVAYAKGQQDNRRGQGGLYTELTGINAEGNATYSTIRGWIQDDKEQCTEQPTQGVPDWWSFPTQPPICGGDDGLPTELDGITVSRHRRESIKAYGNAIVPQVAYQIFKAIEQSKH
jgi:DNA (cytosine-5)-methyltransferase 1